MPHPFLLFTVILLLWRSHRGITAPPGSAYDDNDDQKRNRDHIEQILLGDLPADDFASTGESRRNSPSTDEHRFRQKEEIVLHQLRNIYHKTIRPVEKQFHYSDLKRHVLTDADINAKPIVLMVGPWSTGKSTIINYLLGIEETIQGLHVGAEPTTADFTVITHGDEYRTVEGIVLATDATKPFSSMEKFGQIFLEHLLGIEMPRSVLRNITFIDTPGILENRRQQERGYPYNDVLRWLVQRADLIFVVFDPTKLDVGTELESLFLQLKGKEAALRIILNKADSMNEQELMRVYGALYWSLAPLINVTEPPRIYVGSFWSRNYQMDEVRELLSREENSLLKDMREVIRNQVQNKIAFIRQQAIRVRIHALLTDSYISAYRRNKGFFNGGEDLARDIAEHPDRYNVYRTILAHPNVSEYDLPHPDEYEEFFQINQMYEMKRVTDYCGWGGGGCSMDKLNHAIAHQLPQLLQTFQKEVERTESPKTTHCNDKSSECQSSEEKTEQWAKDQWAKAKMYSKQKSDQPPPDEAPKLQGPMKWRKKKVSQGDSAPERLENDEKKEKQDKIMKSKNKILAEAAADDEQNGSSDNSQVDDSQENEDQYHAENFPDDDEDNNNSETTDIGDQHDSKSPSPFETETETEDHFMHGRDTMKDEHFGDLLNSESSVSAGVPIETLEERQSPEETHELNAEHDQNMHEDSVLQDRDKVEEGSEKQDNNGLLNEQNSVPEKNNENLYAQAQSDPTETVSSDPVKNLEDTLETVKMSHMQLDEGQKLAGNEKRFRLAEEQQRETESGCKDRKSCSPRPGFSSEETSDNHNSDKYALLDNNLDAKAKTRCHFRKSCYKTGVIPNLNFKLLQSPQQLHTSRDEETNVLSNDAGSTQRVCKWRKSCYDTGIQPDLNRENIKKSSFHGSKVAVPETKQNQDTEDLSEYSKKLKCLYRKSCYATGKIPELAQPTPTLANLEKHARSEQTEATGSSLTKNQMKIKCQYRKSCYDNVADVRESEPTMLPDPELKTINNGQRIEKCLYRKSCNKNLNTLTNTDKAVQLVNSVPTEEKDNKIKGNCKYRKSCRRDDLTLVEKRKQYGQEKLREKIDHNSQPKLPDDTTPPTQPSKEHRCKWRRSCYNTGIIPDLNKPVLQPVSNSRSEYFSEEGIAKSDKMEEVHKPVQVVCKWRKACYETGEMPNLHKKTIEEKQTAKIMDTEQSILVDKKTYCKFRKSCYEKYAKELESKKKRSKDEMAKSEAEVHPELSQPGDIAKQKHQTNEKEHEDEEMNPVLHQPEDTKEAKDAERLPPKKPPIKVKNRNSKEKQHQKRPKTDHSYGSESPTDAATKDLEGTEKKRKSEQMETGNNSEKGNHPLEAQTMDKANGTEEVNEKQGQKGEEKKIESTKISCKWRKSCYATGVLPEIPIATTLQQEVEPTEEKETGSSIQERCKWRKNCYETGIVTQFSPNPSTSLKTEIKADDNYKEEQTVQQRCKWRKDCYISGVTPKLPSKREPASHPEAIHPAVTSEDSKNDKSTLQQKCQFRKSCYETGTKQRTKPTPVQKSEVEPKQIMDKPLNVQKNSGASIQQTCKFRKTCYKTGIRPDLNSIASQKDEMQKSLDVDGSDSMPLQQKCKFRKSCYKLSDASAKVSVTKEAEEKCDKKSCVAAGERRKHDGTQITKTKQEAKVKNHYGEIVSDPNGKKMEVTVPEEQSAAEANSDLKYVKQKQKQNQTQEAQREQDKINTEKPKPSILEKSSSNELKCKYRKSCDALSKKDAPGVKKNADQVEAEKPDSLLIDSYAIQKKRCKFRKSCYETGLLPDLKSQETQTPAVLKVEEEPETVQSKCKWRKSCYETGIVPTIELQEKKYTETQTSVDEHDVPSALINIKLICHYRKSCYESGMVPKKSSETKEQQKCKKYSKSCSQAKERPPHEDLKGKVLDEPGSYETLVKPASLEQKKKDLKHWENRMKDETILPETTNNSLKCNKWRISCRTTLGLPPKLPKLVTGKGKPKKLCRKKVPSDNSRQKTTKLKM